MDKTALMLLGFRRENEELYRIDGLVDEETNEFLPMELVEAGKGTETIFVNIHEFTDAGELGLEDLKGEDGTLNMGIVEWETKNGEQLMALVPNKVKENCLCRAVYVGSQDLAQHKYAYVEIQMTIEQKDGWNIAGKLKLQSYLTTKKGSEIDEQQSQFLGKNKETILREAVRMNAMLDKLQSGRA